MVECFEELSDQLHHLSGDSDFEDADRDDFGNLSGEAGDAAEAFSENPKYGASSDKYDRVLTAGRNAVDAARNTSAADGNSIRRCKEKSRAALDAIASVTS